VAEAYGDENLLAPKCSVWASRYGTIHEGTCSFIKEMARGVRDGKIFGSPGKAPHLDANCRSTYKGMAEGFSGREFCRLGHFGGSVLLDTVDPKKPPILCKGMAEHLRDKKGSVAILSNLQEDPPINMEMATGVGTVRSNYFFALC
jgi:hypothetical protein